MDSNEYRELIIKKRLRPQDHQAFDACIDILTNQGGALSPYLNWGQPFSNCSPNLTSEAENCYIKLRNFGLNDGQIKKCIGS
ncbi:hypothetical protein [Dendronalium sp. ChiSLP03b]|uniref:hypothetical protein n=1 Tax=Dendronalium sp. ChiSLP03b TaxID=3075381 RepID=UPI002ADB298B|nr:hypothetical protein [Dendronalium sp. ChiSLP03b]